jgi:hypothetical protein
MPGFPAAHFSRADKRLTWRKLPVNRTDLRVIITGIVKQYCKFIPLKAASSVIFQIHSITQFEGMN